MLEVGAANVHVLGGGKFYQPEAVVVNQLVYAKYSDGWFISLLLSDISMKVSDHDLHVVFWAAVVLPLQLRVEGLFLVNGAPKMRTVYISNHY